MSSPGQLPADALLPLVGHTVHWTLTFGGLLALAALLVAARPGRAAPVRRPADARRRQLALLATATTGPTDSRAGVTGSWGLLAVRASAPAASCAAAHTWLPVAVVSSAAAAGVHAAAGPAHFREGLLVGGFFALAALGQLGWAAVVMLSGPARGLMRAGLVANAAVVVLWLATRTVGLPGGLVAVEPVGPWDLAATVWELAVVAGVSLVLGSARFADSGTRGVDIVRWSAAARAWLLVSVTLMAVLTVAGTSG